MYIHERNSIYSIPKTQTIKNVLWFGGASHFVRNEQMQSQIYITCGNTTFSKACYYNTLQKRSEQYYYICISNIYNAVCQAS